MLGCNYGFYDQTLFKLPKRCMKRGKDEPRSENEIQNSSYIKSVHKFSCPEPFAQQKKANGEENEMEKQKFI